MKTKKYTDPKEAFEIMNKATRIQTSYETKFKGKEVTRVDISFKGDQPRVAFVHYRTDTHIGVNTIDLTKKLL